MNDRQPIPDKTLSDIQQQPRAYLEAMGIVLIAIGCAFAANRLLPHANLSLLFLTGVLVVAARAGLWPSLFSGVLSFLAFNFFFTPPFYTFAVEDDGDVATLLFFLLMAAITGNLAAHMHRERAANQASLRRLSMLYEFGRRMSTAMETEQVLDALSEHLTSTLHYPLAMLIADTQDRPALRHATCDRPPSQHAIERAWARAASDRDEEIGEWHFLRLNTHRRPVGLVAIQASEIDAEQLELAHSLCNQAALALDRILLATDLERSRIETETEQLRSALLSSVSHDLRTPLASIIGSATSLLDYGEALSSDNRQELLKTVLGESQRLDRYIQNLLDMTRLGHGTLPLRRDWVDLHDVVSSAMNRLRNSTEGLHLKIEIAPEVPLLKVHGALLEQALVNLLDNAVRFSPEDGQITVKAHATEQAIDIEICDQGPGIPPEEREQVFDMFYTASQGDRGDRQGTGLGLAICRGLIGAHGGSVTAHEGPQGIGTCMRITLPATESDTKEQPHEQPKRHNSHHRG